MSIGITPSDGIDEFRAWGMDNRGNRYPAIHGFMSDWNKLRELYLAQNPNVVCMNVSIALPDLKAMAEGRTRGQLTGKSNG